MSRPDDRAATVQRQDLSMIVDWITNLLDATGLLTRDHCGPWSNSLMSFISSRMRLIVLAHMLVALCLYADRQKAPP